MRDMGQLKRLFLDEAPMIDVRAEVEFAQGAFPGAVNIPILNDEERHLVGISYRSDGPDAAEKLGYELVAGDEKAQRLERWIDFVDQNPGTFLYCFRGGKRSQIACEWLKDVGTKVTRIPGGYKSMRRFLLDQFQNIPRLLVVSGKTGVGKTELLSLLDGSVNLEHLAHHRGSAFGRHPDPQPSQISFENAVAINFLKFTAGRSQGSLYVEDEGRLIGRIQLPQALQTAMKMAPIILLEDSLENRVCRIYQEYIVCQWQEYSLRFSDTAEVHFSEYLYTAIDAIRKRLGGVAHAKVRKLLQNALESQKSGDFEPHKTWIKPLLQDYYDPMYSYQLEKKADRIVHRGSLKEILAWSNEPTGFTHG